MAILGAVFVPRLGRIPGPSQLTRLERKLERRDLGFFNAIGAGRMLATADFNAMQMAYLAAECAVRHLRGEVVPERIELPVQIVDARNCEQWNLPYEARPVITLEQLNDRRQAP